MTDQAVSHQPLIDPMELEAIITEVLDALVVNAGIDLETPIPPEQGIDPSPLSGQIVVHADTDARLTIDSDARACATLARCWGLIGPGGATTQDALDALGELCNLIGATVKTVFDEESHVGIPETTEGSTDWAAEAVDVVHPTGTFTARFGRY